MYVFIDPAEREAYHFYSSRDTRAWEEARFPRTEFASLLAALLHFLAEQGESLQTLKGIIVRVGKGSFTADRIAITTVNMLVFSLSIPALTTKELAVDAVGEALRSVTKPQYIVAEYSAPPNVGTKEPYIG